MLALFKSNSIGAYVGLVVFAILIHLVGFILPVETFQAVVVTQGKFANELYHDYPTISKLLAFTANGIVVVVLINISRKINRFKSKDLLIPYAFLVFCGCSLFMMEFSIWHLLLVGNALLVYIIFSLYEMVRDKAPLYLFVLGFIAGLFILVDSTNLFFLLVILLGVVLFKPSQNRDVLVFLLGFAVILFFIFSIYFIQEFDTGLKELIVSEVHVSSKNVFLPFQPFYLLFVVLLVGVVYELFSYTRNNIFSRKVHRFLIALLAVNILVTLVNGRSMFANSQSFGIVFGIYVGQLFTYNKIKWIPEALNALMLLIVFWYQYDYYLPIKFQEIPSFLF